MKKYVCNTCGYVYNPEKGDQNAEIKPGTMFENLPYYWVCPTCSMLKDDFNKEE